MTAVEGYAGGYSRVQHGYFNTDPGVYEPECDFYEEDQLGPTGYPDTQEFLDGIQEKVSQEAKILEAEEEIKPSSKLSQYKGLGGPKSIPLRSPGEAFEKPPAPVVKTLLDDIFLEPTENQLNAYNRVILKGSVVQNKNRLRWTIFLHYCLLFVLLCKLTPEILDKLDIFVLEVEELFVPKPLIWEWLWLLSIPVTLFGLSACKHSSIKSVKNFLVGSLVCSLLPILLGMGMFLMDIYEFLSEGVSDDIVVWQGYPYAVLWYAFFFVALQVHIFEIYFGNCLLQAWLPLQSKKQQ